MNLRCRWSAPASRSTRQPSFIASLIPIIGGGLLACPLAYYIVLLIGGPEKDFLELGPSLRWILPASFSEPRTTPKPSNSGSKLTAQNSGNADSQADKRGAADSSDSSDAMANGAGDPADSDPASGDTDSGDPVETPLSAFDDLPTELAGPTADDLLPDDTAANRAVPPIDPVESGTDDAMPDADKSDFGRGRAEGDWGTG